MHIIGRADVINFALVGCIVIADIASLSASLCSEASEAVPRYGVFEETLKWESDRYENPWEQVRVTATFTAPKGEKTIIGGFYCAPDTWKVRFSPSEIGNWNWRAEIADGTESKSFRGSFKVVESDLPGFVRQSPYNKFRWILENGEPYYPIGIGDCIPKEGSSRKMKTWGLDGGFRPPDQYDGWMTDIDVYLRA